MKSFYNIPTKWWFTLLVSFLCLVSLYFKSISTLLLIITFLMLSFSLVSFTFLSVILGHGTNTWNRLVIYVICTVIVFMYSFTLMWNSILLATFKKWHYSQGVKYSWWLKVLGMYGVLWSLSSNGTMDLRFVFFVLFCFNWF